jgi:hypothetical protein
VAAGVAAAVVATLVRFALGLGLLIVTWWVTRSWHGYFTRAVRRELWAALKISAHPLVGDRAFEPGFDARTIALGLGVLFGFFICVGVVFALLAYGRSRRTSFSLALLFAIGVWLLEALFIVRLPGTAIVAIPASLALAGGLLWYERRFPQRP